MDYCYYIISNSTTTGKGNLTIGDRIFAIPTSNPIILNFTDGEGPFYNLEYLIENSKLYNILKINNPRRAHKIIQNEYINKIENFLFTPKGKIFDSNLINSWEHIVRGEFKSTGITGVHFFDEKYVQIVNIIKQNSNGVIHALIKVRRKKDDNWILKTAPTSLFPITWTVQNLIMELDFAYNNRTILLGFENRYKGTTSKGIEVVFVVLGGKLKTAYPLIDS